MTTSDFDDVRPTEACDTFLEHDGYFVPEHCDMADMSVENGTPTHCRFAAASGFCLSPFLLRTSWLCGYALVAAFLFGSGSAAMFLDICVFIYPTLPSTAVSMRNPAPKLLDEVLPPP